MSVYQWKDPTGWLYIVPAVSLPFLPFHLCTGAAHWADWPFLTILLPFPLSQSSQASWSRAFSAFSCSHPLLNIPCTRNPPILAFDPWDAQINTSICFLLPCELVNTPWGTFHIAWLYIWYIDCISEKVVFKATIFISKYFVQCYWDRLLLEHSWPCDVLRKCVMVHSSLPNSHGFCSILFHKVCIYDG
jgi:hypothetical protein